MAISAPAERQILANSECKATYATDSRITTKSIIFAPSNQIQHIDTMNEQLLKSLSDKCRDYGLTKQYLVSLAETGAAGLAEEASGEEIEARAVQLAAVAKLTQGEITRKTKPQPKPQPTDDKSEPQPAEGSDAPKPADNSQSETIAQLIAKLDKQSRAIEELTAERAQEARTARIKAAAKEVGLPESVALRVNIQDDGDLAAQLTEVKQAIITSSLAPKGRAEEQVKQASEANLQHIASKLIDSLPDSK